MTFNEIRSALLAHSDSMQVLWRTFQDGGAWIAEVRAGSPDGAFPVWSGRGDNEEAALVDAARTALLYWTRDR